MRFLNIIKPLFTNLRNDDGSLNFMVFFFLMIPFTQGGMNLLVSVQGLLLFLLIFTYRRYLDLRYGVFVMIFFLISQLSASIQMAEIPFNFMRDFRYAVGCAVVVTFLNIRERVELQGYSPQLPLAVLWILFAIVVAQVLLLKMGINPFMPAEYYWNSGDNILMTKWFEFHAEIGMEFHGRATAFYSEPSYLGMISIFLHYITVMTSSDRKEKMTATILSLLISSVAMTGLGVLGNIVILFLVYRDRMIKISFAMIPVVILLLLLGSNLGFLPERFFDIITGNDASANIRIVEPFRIMWHQLTMAPLGIPLTGVNYFFGTVHGIISLDGDTPFHNGFFNMVITFGIFVIPIIIAMFRNSNLNYFIFFLIIASQNGATFEFDKVVIYSISFILLFCFRTSETRRTNEKLSC